MEQGGGAPIIQEPRKEDLLANFGVLAKEVQQRFPFDADVCLYVGSKYFALHRVVLYGRSEYFAKLLTSGFKEGREAGGENQGSTTTSSMVADDNVSSSGILPTIPIADISAAAFAVVVEFMYSDQCSPDSLQGQLLLEVR